MQQQKLLSANTYHNAIELQVFMLLQQLLVNNKRLLAPLISAQPLPHKQ